MDVRETDPKNDGDGEEKSLDVCRIQILDLFNNGELDPEILHKIVDTCTGSSQKNSKILILEVTLPDLDDSLSSKAEFAESLKNFIIKSVNKLVDELIEAKTGKTDDPDQVPTSPWWEPWNPPSQDDEIREEDFEASRPKSPKAAKEFPNP